MVFTLRAGLMSYAGLFHKTVSSFRLKAQPRFKTHLNRKAALIIPLSLLSLSGTPTVPNSAPPNPDAVLYLFHLVLIDIHVFFPMRGHVP